jgi:hypothetical protein
MSTYYVDLSQVETGDGSSGSPFNFTQLLAQTFIEGDIYKLRGSISIDETLLSIGPNCPYVVFSLVAWDLDLYGPWRIANTGIIHINANSHVIQNEVSGGILYSQGIFVYTRAYNINNMFINTKFESFPNSGVAFESTIIKGCTAICNYQLSAGSTQTQFIDCVLDIGEGYPYHIYNGCLFTCSTDSVGGTKTDCQFNWTPPSWPAWDANKLLFSKSILYANEPDRPPSRGVGGGHPYFAGYSTDLFGRRRNDIGAYYADRHDKIYVDVTNYYLIDGSLKLYDDTIGATTWSWKIGSTTVSTEQNPVIGNSIASYVDEIIDINGIKYLPISLTTDTGVQARNIKIQYIGDYNDIVWDGSKFVIVGDNGIIVTTVDGTSPITGTVPSGVESYKLTGITCFIGCGSTVCVVVGTKTVSPGNYRLLILVSGNGSPWAIDAEIDFTSSYDPSISQIKIFNNGYNFIINGSTLHVITGYPGSWSSPISLPYDAGNKPVKGMMFRSGSYYALFTNSSCSNQLMIYKCDTSFGYIASYTVDSPVTDNGERSPFFYDAGSSLWTVSYHDSNANKFVIITSSNLSSWYPKDIDISSSNLPISHVVLGDPIYIVGGSLTNTGIVYYQAACGAGWNDITELGQVSINAVAFNGTLLVLAVGRLGSITVLAS